MADAALIFESKRVYDDGAILQMRLWRLPDAARVRGSLHPFKYSLFYGAPGTRLVAYDNEAGKGDHVHRGEVESRYAFTSPERLVADFLAEVAALRGGRL